ncbi:MAG: accessory factor UbiK family protein [Gammaproteobacteria bacterium]|nr:accessory factor UbiK family protein [Gammaproteobacteria bacterium]
MLSAAQLTKLAQQIVQSIPGTGLDLQKHLHVALINQLQKLELVTREEFEIQARLLERSQEKLAQMEQQVAELEKHVLPGK